MRERRGRAREGREKLAVVFWAEVLLHEFCDLGDFTADDDGRYVGTGIRPRAYRKYTARGSRRATGVFAQRCECTHSTHVVPRPSETLGLGCFPTAARRLVMLI